MAGNVAATFLMSGRLATGLLMLSMVVEVGACNGVRSDWVRPLYVPGSEVRMHRSLEFVLARRRERRGCASRTCMPPNPSKDGGTERRWFGQETVRRI
ncbi:hypothetical protein F4802DRAFT_574961 [Xylaria palmicola]|nr:hypothetical protein F4802DRAFT_574961 [Xylaria palmicola]